MNNDPHNVNKKVQGASNKPQLFNRILVAVDDSEQASWAVDVASELAMALAGQVALVNVVSVPDPTILDLTCYREAEVEDELRHSSEDILHKAQVRLPKSIRSECIVGRGYPSDGIIATAGEWTANLIVIGTRGCGRLAQLLLGSTAEAVIRRAPCPVLAIAHPSKAAHAFGAVAGANAALDAVESGAT